VQNDASKKQPKGGTSQPFGLTCFCRRKNQIFRILIRKKALLKGLYRLSKIVFLPIYLSQNTFQQATL
jgi:hypothetical protein